MKGLGYAAYMTVSSRLELSWPIITISDFETSAPVTHVFCLNTAARLPPTILHLGLRQPYVVVWNKLQPVTSLGVSTHLITHFHLWWAQTLAVWNPIPHTNVSSFITRGISSVNLFNILNCLPTLLSPRVIKWGMFYFKGRAPNIIKI